MKKTTKDRILKAAVEVLEKEGIPGLTQLSVAKKIGISQGQLTYHFPKRADLILATTDVALDRIASSVFANQEPTKISGGLAEQIWNLIRDLSRIRALLGLITEADQNSEVKERMLLQEERIRALIAFGLGLKEDNELVTFVHATFLGFGLISFLRGEDPKQLHKDFLFAVNQIEKIVKAPDKTNKRKKR